MVRAGRIFMTSSSQSATLDNQSLLKVLACRSLRNFARFAIKPERHASAPNNKTVSMLGCNCFKSTSDQFAHALNTLRETPCPPVDVYGSGCGDKRKMLPRKVPVRSPGSMRQTHSLISNMDNGSPYPLREFDSTTISGDKAANSKLKNSPKDHSLSGYRRQ